MNPPAQKPRSFFWPVVGGCGGCLILVVLLGLTIGVPAFNQYIARSKAAEPRGALSSLAMQVAGWCRDNPGAALTAGPVPPMPSETPVIGEWGADPGFAQLGFRLDDHRYRYSIVPSAGGGHRLLAEGDLDGNGVLSTYSIECSADCVCGQLSIANELE